MIWELIHMDETPYQSRCEVTEIVLGPTETAVEPRSCTRR